MDLALAVLLLWGLLFMPIGLVLHWLVLGEGSRVRALPLAPVTGIALAVSTFATLGRLGIDAGSLVVLWVVVGVSIACALVTWRRDVPWRSQELIGAGLLLLFAVVLIQMPVVGDEGDGPLGYGTTANPVVEVAAIEAAAGGPSAELGVAVAASESADERAIGFEQFAAFTVALGIGNEPEAGEPRDTTWSAYGLHATITGMFAALIALPLFAFARARGVRWFGLIVLMPLGVLAPAVFVALANGEGAAVSSVAFTTAAGFSLLVTRRDRGWWALAVIYGAAVAATAGPIALLPLVAIGIAWNLLRSDTYEHLSQHDAPVASLRTLAVTGVAAGLGGIATVPLVASGGEMLSWTALHTRLVDALRFWPFSWLDSNLTTAGPETPFETAVWLIGPALIAVAVIYALVRNERRELGVLVGSIAAATVAALFAVADLEAGIRAFEFTMLSLSPFLAALALRAVALAREHSSDSTNAPVGRLAGLGPTVLVVAFVLLSFAATTVTGTRMVHAPAVSPAQAAPANGDPDSIHPAIIAAGDPWLGFIVDGEGVVGGYADADAISEERNGLSSVGTRTTGYDQVIVSSSPLSSDPGLRYIEQSDLDEYQVRLFRDRLASPLPAQDFAVDSARLSLRARTETADRPGSERSGSEAGAAGGDAGDAVDDVVGDSATGSGPTIPLARVHLPVEGADRNMPPDRPAGLLLPPTDVPGCASSRDEDAGSTCEPAEPVRGKGCTDADVAAARSPDDRDRRGRVSALLDRAQVLFVEADQRLPRRPPMVGIQCFDVPLASSSTVLLVHLRDVGHVLPSEDADASGDWDTERDEDRIGGSEGVNGGTTRTTSELGASLTFGAGRLSGGLQYDVVVEGSLGAGIGVSSNTTVIGGGADSEFADDLPAAEFGTLRGAADGFSSILRQLPLSGTVTVTNQAGTDVEIGRVFARPRDLPRSCDVPIAISSGEQREVRVDVQSSDGGQSVERPGLTVTVLDVERGEDATARIAVATYLTRSGLPRYTLVDWTEQYETELQVEGCDGTLYTERGAQLSAAGQGIDVVGDDLDSALGSGGGGRGGG
jgi:hypothetical protein